MSSLARRLPQPAGAQVATRCSLTSCGLGLCAAVGVVCILPQGCAPLQTTALCSPFAWYLSWARLQSPKPVSFPGSRLVHCLIPSARSGWVEARDGVEVWVAQCRRRCGVIDRGSSAFPAGRGAGGGWGQDFRRHVSASTAGGLVRESAVSEPSASRGSNSMVGIPHLRRPQPTGANEVTHRPIKTKTI